MQNLESLDQRQRLALLFTQAVQRHGIKHVHVAFDGSGDSGQIDMIEVYSESPKHRPGFTSTTAYEQWGAVHGLDYDVLPAQLWLTRVRRVRGPDNEWIEQGPGLVDCTLGDLLEELVVDLASDHDWYNNEGGYGTFTFDAEEGIGFEQYRRIEESELVAGMEVESTLEWLHELGVEGTV